MSTRQAEFPWSVTRPGTVAVVATLVYFLAFVPPPVSRNSKVVEMLVYVVFMCSCNGMQCSVSPRLDACPILWGSTLCSLFLVGLTVLSVLPPPMLVVGRNCICANLLIQPRC